ncbi:hypothetical protein B2M23_12290 [Eubacterium limosum]|uniref:Uncharacterized protein n=1 Tax=Eubacterium limosum TaxID=1736 RepID=A0AAC9W3H1_EUBLI|nr:hypothetical protein B2M23_12290 [Eubacterium limosum]
MLSDKPAAKFQSGAQRRNRTTDRPSFPAAACLTLLLFRLSYLSGFIFSKNKKSQTCCLTNLRLNFKVVPRGGIEPPTGLLFRLLPV